MKANRLFGRFWSVDRRGNRRRPALEPLEDRLALSPTLPLPPPGSPAAAVSSYPPGPCSFHPPNPC
jgi:hypothetical protein